jgi:FMN phosphatase YigB (HAD superfamily)
MTDRIPIAACVFDAYGTLFDFRGAVERRAVKSSVPYSLERNSIHAAVGD